MVVGAILAHMGMKPRQSAWGPSWVAILAKVSNKLIEIWQPGPGYASVFPSNATGVAFLRADLNGPGAAATA